MKQGLSDLEMILQENGEDTADCSFGGFHRGVELRTTVTHKSHLVVNQCHQVNSNLTRASTLIGSASRLHIVHTDFGNGVHEF